jgi:hypothetical protein
MGRYDKIKEYNCIDYFEKRGAVLMVHFGDRHHKSGDFLVSYKGTILRCDHKSSRNAGGLSIRIQKDWMLKLVKENNEFPDVNAIPVITLSFLGWRDYYCLIKDCYVNGNPSHETILDPDHNSWVVPTHSLVNTPVLCLGVDTLLMRVDILLRIIDEGLLTP